MIQMELLRRIQDCCNKKNYEKMYYRNDERVLQVDARPKAMKYMLPESSSSSESTISSSPSISDDNSISE